MQTMMLKLLTILLFLGLLSAVGLAGVLISRNLGNTTGGTATESNSKPASKETQNLKELSVEERQKYFDDLLTHNASSLFDEWLSSLSTKDGLRISLIAAALSQVLQKDLQGGETFYPRARQALLDPSAGSAMKEALVSIMGQTATLPTLQILVDMTKENLSDSLRRAVYDAIKDVGVYSWRNNQFHTELSPILVRAWQGAADPKLLDALGPAIAAVGDVDGVNQLFNDALAQESTLSEMLNSFGNARAHGKTLSEIQNSRDWRAFVAWSSLVEKLSNPDLIPEIVKRLNYPGATKAEITICANILASMPVPGAKAIRLLFTWAQNADDSYAPMIREAFNKSSSSDSFDFLFSAKTQNLPFKSNLVKEAVFSSIRKVKFQ